MPFLLSFLLAFSFAQAAEPSREQAAHEAAEKFLQLNFFRNDRGMHLSPGLISAYEKISDHLPLDKLLRHRWGLNVNGPEVVGLFNRDSHGLKVGVVGCVACHSGKAAGQLVVGLGNKNIDVVQMAKDVHWLEQSWQSFVPKQKKNARYLDLEDDALAFSSYLGDERIGNLSQGLVPVSFIRGWFYRVQGEEIPHGMRRGQIKVPFLWGYEEKRKLGLFCDGYGDSREVGWAVAVELAAGQRPEVVREYYPEVRHAEELFSKILPPKYPFAVNEGLAEKGKALFTQTCAHCHGTYENDAEGWPIFQEPRFIPWAVVRTDDDRILGNTPAFNAQVERSPLHDLIGHTDFGPGYFAPRLEGVWARFPYLHNGSVPNLAALLTKPANRPRFWSVRDAGERSRFDETRLGLTLPEKREAESLLRKAKRGVRWVYSTERTGHSNQGHDFYTGLTGDEKHEILEYLKTL